jgi:uncharacterized protein
MKLGLLSDTHGHVAAAKSAIDVLLMNGAEVLIHCGDVGDFSRDFKPILDLLAGHETYFVYGNNDLQRPAMDAYAIALGLHCLGVGGEITLDNKRIYLTHGDRPNRITAALDTPGLDYLFTGHSHVPHDRRVNGVRHINPGALFRCGKKTVATLDTESDTLTYHDA